MDKYKKAHMQTSQYRMFLSNVVVYTTSVLTISSKNMPDHLGLSIMMLWFIALSVSILQQLPEELIMVCNLFSRTGSSCQREPLTGKGRRCSPARLSQTRGQVSDNPLRIRSRVPLCWTDNSCFFQRGAVGSNSVKTDLVLNSVKKMRPGWNNGQYFSISSLQFTHIGLRHVLDFKNQVTHTLFLRPHSSSYWWRFLIMEFTVSTCYSYMESL